VWLLQDVKKKQHCEYQKKHRQSLTQRTSSSGPVHQVVEKQSKRNIVVDKVIVNA